LLAVANEVKLRKAFSLALKQLRDKANLSQQELADYANVDRSFISQLERGIGLPSLSVIYKLSEVFKIKAYKFIEQVDKNLES
jgi:transcriptional regulator with XRE-family HTH domain